MFLIRFLAFFDIFAGVLLVLAPLVPLRLLFGHGLYLMIKGKLFKGDFFSAMDFAIGMYCLFALFFPLNLLNIFAGVFLFIKGGLSMFA